MNFVSSSTSHKLPDFLAAFGEGRLALHLAFELRALLDGADAVAVAGRGWPWRLSLVSKTINATTDGGSRHLHLIPDAHIPRRDACFLTLAQDWHRYEAVDLIVLKGTSKAAVVIWCYASAPAV